MIHRRSFREIVGRVVDEAYAWLNEGQQRKSGVKGVINELG